jgi:hypothetical protein
MTSERHHDIKDEGMSILLAIAGGAVAIAAIVP